VHEAARLDAVLMNDAEGRARHVGHAERLSDRLCQGRLAHAKFAGERDDVTAPKQWRDGPTESLRFAGVR